MSYGVERVERAKALPAQHDSRVRTSLTGPAIVVNQSGDSASEVISKSASGNCSVSSSTV